MTDGHFLTTRLSLFKRNGESETEQERELKREERNERRERERESTNSHLSVDWASSYDADTSQSLRLNMKCKETVESFTIQEACVCVCVNTVNHLDSGDKLQTPITLCTRTRTRTHTHRYIHQHERGTNPHKHMYCKCNTHAHTTSPTHTCMFHLFYLGCVPNSTDWTNRGRMQHP